MDTGMALYYNMRPLIKQADIIEWRSNNLIGWAIRARTRKNVNHTSMALLYQMVGGEQVRRYIGEAVSNGFCLNYLSDELRGYDGEVYLLRLKEKFNSFRIKIATALTALEGTGYDYMSLFGNLRRRARLDGKRVFCSEAVQIALIRSGLLDENFNEGFALVPGEFEHTSVYRMPVRIY